jgi:DHA1 family multidrug resistance protein-like MFS transporter
MFKLRPSYTNPVRRTDTAKRFLLGPSEKGLPPSLEASRDAYLVEITGNDDPANAKTWEFSRKMIAAFVLGFDTLVASWGSSVYSAAVAPVAMEFGVSSVVAILGLTLYICGFATGPLAFGPLSELYGRKWPITIASFVFVSSLDDGEGMKGDGVLT